MTDVKFNILISFYYLEVLLKKISINIFLYIFYINLIILNEINIFTELDLYIIICGEALWTLVGIQFWYYI